MKRAISVVLLIAVLASMFCLSGCSNKRSNINKIDAYVLSDTKAEIILVNRTGETVYSIKGYLNLFEGSGSNQTSIEKPEFEWEGICGNGGSVTISVDIDSSEKNLRDRVTKIGYKITSCS